MSTNKTLREMKRFAEGLGLGYELVGKNKHAKVRLTRPDGQTTLYVLPVSSGSQNNERNRQADIRRFARGESV